MPVPQQPVAAADPTFTQQLQNLFGGANSPIGGLIGGLGDLSSSFFGGGSPFSQLSSLLGLFGTGLMIPEIQNLIGEQDWAWNQQQNATRTALNPAMLNWQIQQLNRPQNFMGDINMMNPTLRSMLQGNINALNNPQQALANMRVFNQPGMLAGDIKSLQQPLSQNMIDQITAGVQQQVGGQGLGTSPMMQQYALGQALAQPEMQLQQLASQLGQGVYSGALQGGMGEQQLGYSAGGALQSLASQLGIDANQLAAQLGMFGLQLPFQLGSGIAGGAPVFGM